MALARVDALRAVAHAYILGGGVVSDELRGEIDQASPCTREDCWDVTAPQGPTDPDGPVPEPSGPDAGAPGSGTDDGSDPDTAASGCSPGNHGGGSTAAMLFCLAIMLMRRHRSI